jgi:predicted nucleic acid-binding protein
MGPILLDTGPLVAFLNRRDRFHEWSKEIFGGIGPSVLSCEAVLSESCFLLRHTENGAEAILRLVERGLIRLSFRLEAESAAVRRLLARYAGVPMSLADACLVRMSEQVPASTVLTLDRDFKIYRKHGRNVIPTITPAGLGRHSARSAVREW